MEAFQRHWEEKTLESSEAKWYMRDINTMLMDKGLKARHYLYRKEFLMLEALRGARFERARVLFEGLAKLYGKLQEEESRDAEARN